MIEDIIMANLGKENEIIEFKELTAEFDKACKAIVGMLNKNGVINNEKSCICIDNNFNSFINIM